MLHLPGDEVHVWMLRGQGASDGANHLRRAAHAGARQVLARYLDRAPDDIRFVARLDGKPALLGDGSLRFNLSHSGAVAAVAVACREVGVDVERRRAVRSQDGVARRILNDVEHARYAALAPEERVEFLLWAWARKEALLKASGTGIRGSLQAVACEPVEHDAYSVVDLDVPGYAAAVAAEGRGWRVVVQDGPLAG